MGSKLYVIVGPTSTGKTTLAIELCKEFGGCIVAADSRQVFKHMDIGTGKLPLEKSELDIKKETAFWTIDGIQIHGYDLTEPTNYYSAFEYGTFAINKINTLAKATQKNIFLVGGTGFYIDTVLGKVTLSKTPPDYDLRNKLQSTDIADLNDRLQELNPQTYKTIDKKNKVRIVRALERELIPTEQAVLEKLEISPTKIIGLTGPRDFLYNRVDIWTETVYKKGLLEEVSYLLESDFKESPMLHGLIYKNAVEFLKGKKKKQVAIQETKYALHAYIRRQQTWFKKDMQTAWVDISKTEARDTVTNLLK